MCVPTVRQSGWPEHSRQWQGLAKYLEHPVRDRGHSARISNGWAHSRTDPDPVR